MQPIRAHGYAVGTGVYVGEIFIYIKQENENFEFISIPKNINRIVPKEKFILGLQHKIIEDIGPIDTKVFNLLDKQFEFNKFNTK
jgi:hypothetical protein